MEQLPREARDGPQAPGHPYGRVPPVAVAHSTKVNPTTCSPDGLITVGIFTVHKGV